MSGIIIVNFNRLLMIFHLIRIRIILLYFSYFFTSIFERFTACTSDINIGFGNIYFLAKFFSKEKREKKKAQKLTE